MTIVAQHLPVQLNLSMQRDPLNCIGFADIAIGSDGRAHIEIILDEEATKRLGDLTELFELYGLGFAALRKRPEASTNPGGHGWTKPVAPPNDGDRPKPHDPGKAGG